MSLSWSHSNSEEELSTLHQPPQQATVPVSSTTAAQHSDTGQPERDNASRNSSFRQAKSSSFLLSRSKSNFSSFRRRRTSSMRFGDFGELRDDDSLVGLPESPLKSSANLRQEASVVIAQVEELSSDDEEDLMPIPTRKAETEKAGEVALLYVESFREKLYYSFEGFPSRYTADPPWPVIAMVVGNVTLILVVLTVVLLMVESIPNIGGETPIFVLESIAIYWFVIDFFTRLATVYNRWLFVRKLMNIIDFITIVPYFISLGVSDSQGLSAIVALRALRLVRVMRVFKLSRQNGGLQDLVKAMTRASIALSLLAFLLFIAILIYSSAMYMVEQMGAEFDENSRAWIRDDGTLHPFQSIFHTMWWCIVTMTTVGYGDEVPTTGLGKTFATLSMFSGVLVLAFPTVILSATFHDAFVSRTTNQVMLTLASRQVEIQNRDADATMDDDAEDVVPFSMRYIAFPLKALKRHETRLKPSTLTRSSSLKFVDSMDIPKNSADIGRRSSSKDAGNAIEIFSRLRRQSSQLTAEASLKVPWQKQSSEVVLNAQGSSLEGRTSIIAMPQRHGEKSNSSAQVLSPRNQQSAEKKSDGEETLFSNPLTFIPKVEESHVDDTVKKEVKDEDEDKDSRVFSVEEIKEQTNNNVQFLNEKVALADGRGSVVYAPLLEFKCVPHTNVLQAEITKLHPDGYNLQLTLVLDSEEHRKAMTSRAQEKFGEGLVRHTQMKRIWKLKLLMKFVSPEERGIMKVEHPISEETRGLVDSCHLSMETFFEVNSGTLPMSIICPTAAAKNALISNFQYLSIGFSFLFDRPMIEYFPFEHLTAEKVLYQESLGMRKKGEGRQNEYDGIIFKRKASVMASAFLRTSSKMNSLKFMKSTSNVKNFLAGASEAHELVDNGDHPQQNHQTGDEAIQGISLSDKEESMGSLQKSGSLQYRSSSQFRLSRSRSSMIRKESREVVQGDGQGHSALKHPRGGGTQHKEHSVTFQE